MTKYPISVIEVALLFCIHGYAEIENNTQLAHFDITIFMTHKYQNCEYT